MSGAARRRGQARGQRGDGSDDFPRRGRGGRGGRGGGIPPFDGPASRGTGSVSGPQGGRGSNAPSSVTPSQGEAAGSRRSSVSQPPPQPQQPASASGATAGLDPARDRPDSKFDDMRNIDFPASFYNMDVSSLFFPLPDPCPLRRTSSVLIHRLSCHPKHQE